MKVLSIFLSLGVFNLAGAKESLADLESIKEYKNDQANHIKSDIPPGKSFSELIIKINAQSDPNIPLEEILFALSNARNSPSADLIPQLKTIWSYYRKSTFRATSPDEWQFIKALDSNQVICDEIKILVKSMGGNLDDIEPLDERITFDLNKFRALLKGIKNGSGKYPLGNPELKSLIEELTEIVKKCNFGSSNEDEKLQVFYILAITELLGDKKVYPIQKSTDEEGPIITLFDETLSKTLPLIDENWIQRPTGSNDKNQDTPNIEQTIQWRKNSLEGYQQMNLRRIRDQILVNVSNMIEMRKADDTFEQEMLKRFSKNDACRKVIEDRLSSSK